MNLKNAELNSISGWLRFFVISLEYILPSAGLLLTFLQFRKIMELIGINNEFVVTGSISCAIILYLINESIRSGRRLRRKDKQAVKKAQIFLSKFFYLGIISVFIHLFGGIEPSRLFLDYYFYFIGIVAVYVAGYNYLEHSIRVKNIFKS